MPGLTLSKIDNFLQRLRQVWSQDVFFLESDPEGMITHNLLLGLKHFLMLLSCISLESAEHLMNVILSSHDECSSNVVLELIYKVLSGDPLNIVRRI